jgi:single-strand DNA-binding protein
MNVLTIAGNLGRDCRLNSVAGSNGPISVANFAVAVQKRTKDASGKYETLWVDCSLWGQRADSIAPYLTKGQKVTVSGVADVEIFVDGNGNTLPKMTLRANDVTLMGSRQDAPQGQPQNAPQQPQQQSAYQQPPQRQAAPQQAQAAPQQDPWHDDGMPDF